MDIPWLDRFARGWLDRLRQGRLPHAVLLAGPPGTGKRAAATWIARRRLGIGPQEDLPQHPCARPEHADLRWIEAPEDKHVIGIDQVRLLVQEVGLTSFAGGGKVAVIDPANALTTNAANSLLKTLEEPPGDALLVLIADRMSRLPATIVSRCQRIAFAAPAEDEARAWLERLQPGRNWSEALREAGQAPLAALTAADRVDASTALASDWSGVATGQASALEVAARWAQSDTNFVLDWLARQGYLAIRARAAGRERAPGLAVDESVLQRMDRRRLFCYLDRIIRLRNQPAGSFNVQLSLEGLLIDWADGLRNAPCREWPAGSSTATR